ncbi:hypothetical protein DFH05DRAFT_1494258 [Lentinula detonsa]|uniref:Uncharacterized protein n=1 Tax=Lentinula detonsa TaxID=2804962 RepID=A0A9W8P044_9AGAR|nr:hypothetical protein DFH05DRAFT_1494258 [Lentinula detonsa]
MSASVVCYLTVLLIPLCWLHATYGLSFRARNDIFDLSKLAVDVAAATSFRLFLRRTYNTLYLIHALVVCIVLHLAR